MYIYMFVGNILRYFRYCRYSY